MAVKVYKPTTPGRRKSSVQDFSDITSRRAVKSLIKPLNKRSGRNNQGKITVRHRGGGAKRLYRMVDFARRSYDMPATVTAIEYDPNRSARILLAEYEDGQKTYFLGYDGAAVGDVLISSQNAIEAKTGNRMPLMHIPLGLFVYNVEMQPGKGGQIVRGAGTAAQLMVIEGDLAQLRLPSGEIRLVGKECSATIGKVGNTDFSLVRYGKAGRMRHRGKKPTVKGKNMNPVDHPHGGGEGHSPIGLKTGPKTKWGKKAYGVKTRAPKNWSNKFIVQSRKKKKK